MVGIAVSLTDIVAADVAAVQADTVRHELDLWQRVCRWRRRAVARRGRIGQCLGRRPGFQRLQLGVRRQRLAEFGIEEFLVG